MTPAEHLKHIAKSDMNNIEHVQAVQKHIENLELRIESQNDEIKLMNEYIWNSVSVLNIR